MDLDAAHKSRFEIVAAGGSALKCNWDIVVLGNRFTEGGIYGLNYLGRYFDLVHKSRIELKVLENTWKRLGRLAGHKEFLRKIPGFACMNAAAKKAVDAMLKEQDAADKEVASYKEGMTAMISSMKAIEAIEKGGAND